MRVGNASAEAAANSSSSPAGERVDAETPPPPDPLQSDEARRRRRSASAERPDAASDAYTEQLNDYRQFDSARSAAPDVVDPEVGAPMPVHMTEAEAGGNGTTSAPGEAPVSYDYAGFKQYCERQNSVPRKPQLRGGEYAPLWLQRSHYFENLNVNTQNSSVHVPVNIYDRCAPLDLLVYTRTLFSSVEQRRLCSACASGGDHRGGRVVTAAGPRVQREPEARQEAQVAVLRVAVGPLPRVSRCAVQSR